MKNAILSESERDRIRNARLAKGYSMQALSKMLHYHRGAVESVESGRRAPTPEFLAELYKELGLEQGAE